MIDAALVFISINTLPRAHRKRKEREKRGNYEKFKKA